MEQVILSLLSGFAGSILGAYVTIRIYSSSKRNDAIDNMLSLVHPIGFKSRYSVETGQSSLIFHEHYSELWAAYSALRNEVPIWRKKALTSAWRKFMDMEGLFNDSKPDYWDVFKKGTHMSKEQAVKCCAEFIDHLEKLR